MLKVYQNGEKKEISESERVDTLKKISSQLRDEIKNKYDLWDKNEINFICESLKLELLQLLNY